MMKSFFKNWRGLPQLSPLVFATAFATVLAVVSLGGCAGGGLSATAADGGAALKVLRQINDLEKQIQDLRNTVEEMEFDAENTRRRQQNETLDLDRRLTDIERALRDGLPQGVELAGGEADDAVAEIDVSQSQVQVEDSASVSLAEQRAFDAAFTALKQNKYRDAINRFQRLADASPRSPLADDAYYWMSEARYVNREFEAALASFRTLTTRYPKSSRVPEALLKIGYIQYDIGAYEQAAKTFRDLLKRFPAHQVAVSAQTRLRRIEQTIQ